MGGFYGARLAAAGHDVHFLFRSDYDHVRRHGLLVESPLGDIHLPQPLAYADPADIPPVDVALVCLKTTVEPIVPPQAGAVVLMQNGLGNEERLAATGRVPAGTPLLGGLAFVCSNKVGPGHVRHLDFSRVTLAEHGASTVSPTVRDLAADFEGIGVPVVTEADLALARWKKLVWNVPFNPLSVVLDALPQDLLADPDGRRLVLDLMADVQAGAAACGHAISDRFLADNVAETGIMTPYRTSMKLDFDAGRPLEVAAIVDAPAAAARAAGTPLPRVEAMAALIRYKASNRAF